MEKTRKYSKFHIYVYMTQQKFNKFGQINDRILFIWKNVNTVIFIYIRIYIYELALWCGGHHIHKTCNTVFLLICLFL